MTSFSYDDISKLNHWLLYNWVYHLWLLNSHTDCNDSNFSASALKQTINMKGEKIPQEWRMSGTGNISDLINHWPHDVTILLGDVGKILFI